MYVCSALCTSSWLYIFFYPKVSGCIFVLISQIVVHRILNFNSKIDLKEIIYVLVQVLLDLLTKMVFSTVLHPGFTHHFKAFHPKFSGRMFCIVHLLTFP